MDPTLSSSVFAKSARLRFCPAKSLRLAGGSEAVVGAEADVGAAEAGPAPVLRG